MCRRLLIPFPAAVAGVLLAVTATAGAAPPDGRVPAQPVSVVEDATAAVDARAAAGMMPAEAAAVSGGLVVTDHRRPIYVPGMTPARPVDPAAPSSPTAPESPTAARRADVAGPLPGPAGTAPVPAQLGLTDHQYRDVLEALVLPNGLVLDRNSDRDTVSVAATGLVHHALAVLAGRGVGDAGDTAEAARQGFAATLAANPPDNRGWLSHFTDPAGVPKGWSEVSTIDTALFYGGMLRAAEALGLADFEAEVREAVAAVDLPWLLRDGVFLHGLEWRPAGGAAGVPGGPRAAEFLPYTWDDTSEGVLLYRVFGVPFPEAHPRPDLPLFTYFYPLVLFPDWDAPGSGRPGGEAWRASAADPAGVYEYDGPDYRQLLAEALRWQREHLGHAGVTAADGPGGYTAFKPSLVSPLMLSSLAGHFPEAADTLRDKGLDATLPAYDITTGWDAPDRLAIDYASYFLLRAVVVEPGRVAVPQLADAD